MEHVMTDFEIVKEFREAKNKGEQIKILIDETFKSRAEICEILEKAGEDVHWFKPRKKTVSEPVVVPDPEPVVVPNIVDEDKLPDAVAVALGRQLVIIENDISACRKSLEKLEKEHAEISGFLKGRA